MKEQDVNQIPGTSSCSERVARIHPTWRIKENRVPNAPTQQPGNQKIK